MHILVLEDLVPSWVNVVRDPIDRFVSRFNYLRTEKRWTDRLQRPPKEWFEKDINNCILSGDLECQFNSQLKILKEHQLTYFCGSSPECQMVGSKAALQKGNSVDLFFGNIALFFIRKIRASHIPSVKQLSY